jgi:predicted ABC-type ATPase
MKSSERHQARLFGRVATHVDKVNRDPPYAQWPDLMVLARQRQRNCFFIRLFYVCTKSPEINVARIAKRYMNGGHEVPISKVISRYFKSLEQAKQAITFVDRAYIYDNSIENHLPQLLYRTTDGNLAKQYVADIPEWAQILI